MDTKVLVNDGERQGAGAEIKSIVFDLGGVLFTDGKRVALEALSRNHGYDPAVVGELLTCTLSRDMRKGLISEQAFWSWAAGQIPQGYDARMIRDAWYQGYVPDPDVFELVKSLRGRYRLVAFSENIPDRIAYLNDKYRFREFFDVEIYSYDHQAGKGDPRFLEILLTTLGERPSGILYIDDTDEALALAERRGVNVVHYTTGQMSRIETAMRRLGIAF